MKITKIMAKISITLSLISLISSIFLYIYYSEAIGPSHWELRHVEQYTPKGDRHGDIVERARDAERYGDLYGLFVKGYDYFVPQDKIFPYRWLSLPLALTGSTLLLIGIAILRKH